MRLDCRHCGVLGAITAERIFEAKDALTTYFCDACKSEWDETDSGTQVGGTRTRARQTYRDNKTSS